MPRAAAQRPRFARPAGRRHQQHRFGHGSTPAAEGPRFRRPRTSSRAHQSTCSGQTPSALSIGGGRRIAGDDDLSVRPDRNRPRTILAGRDQIDRRTHHTTGAEGGVRRAIAVQAHRDEVDVRASPAIGPSCQKPVTYSAANWGLGIRQRVTREDDLAIGLQRRSGRNRAEGADRDNNASAVAERRVEVTCSNRCGTRCRQDEGPCHSGNDKVESDEHGRPFLWQVPLLDGGFYASLARNG